MPQVILRKIASLQVVEIFSKYEDILVDEKLANQKGMLPPDYAEKAWKNGLVTFAAFILFGSAPLLSFLILIPFTNNNSIKFAGACILSVLALAILGAAKAKIAQQGYKSSVTFTVFNGAVAAAVAYGITWTLTTWQALRINHGRGAPAESLPLPSEYIWIGSEPFLFCQRIETSQKKHKFWVLLTSCIN